MAYCYTTWSPDLETGNTIIDNQHRQWIDAVNALFDAYKSGKGPQEVESTLKFLTDYTIKHFAAEEALQEKYDYPDYPAHKRIHTGFMGVVQGFPPQLSMHGPPGEFLSHVCTTIGRWVVNHIKTEDCKLAAHIKSKEQSV
jgi:hemerythrin